MKYLDSLEIMCAEKSRCLSLHEGDLSVLPKEQEVDLLIVSAFPNDYLPVKGTLIGALADEGVSLASLAANKAKDYRQSRACWLSQIVTSDSQSVNFKRILCFEPAYRGKPAEVLGDLFRSIKLISEENSNIKSIAMPLVASGSQGAGLLEILEPLLEASFYFLSQASHVQEIKLVEYSPLKAAELKGAFSILKRQYQDLECTNKPEFKYDYFISYSHKNTALVSTFVDRLKVLKPDVALFFDRMSLDTGSAWQREIFMAIDDCRKVIAFYSPDYLVSKVCQEEFDAAYARNRDSDEEVLLPVFLNDVDLPTYMNMVQFYDCREGNMLRLTELCQKL